MKPLVKVLLRGLLYYAGVVTLIARLFPLRCLVILAAHPVVARSDSLLPDGLRVARFADHLAYPGRHHRVLPLSRIVDALVATPPAPPVAMALTFDDGFADSYHEAFDAPGEGVDA